VDAEDGELVGGDGEGDVLDEHLLAPVRDEGVRLAGRSEQQQPLAGVVHVHVRLDRPVRLTQHGIAPGAVRRWHQVRDGVVDERMAILTRHDDHAVAGLDDAHDVPDRAVGPFRAAEVGDEAPAAALAKGRAVVFL